MKTSRRLRRSYRHAAFSLVEVVLALGVVSFAIVAILGVLPVGLATGHSAQDETRAAQIAQSVINTMASQAGNNFTAVGLPLPSPAPALDLSTSMFPPTPGAAPAEFLYANNDGNISQSSTGATYSVSIFTDNFSGPSSSPEPFDSGYANKITVRIVSPPLPNPNATPNPNQTVRDYVRVISKY